MDSVFITGATGFLGGEIVNEIITSHDYKVYVLVRAKDYQTACQRLERLWWEQDFIREEIGRKIIPVVGDITVKNLGLSETSKSMLEKNISYIIHSAAEVDIRETREKLESINIKGTENVLDFAAHINRLKPIKRFSHISTAYVAGDLKGEITEKFNETKEFLSIYEETKYRAEHVVKNYMSIFPISIFRPSQIVGNSQSGFVSSFNTVYYPLRLYMTGRTKVIPVNGNMKMNLVPVDYVTKAIIRITFDQRGKNRVFHLVSNQENLPSFKEILHYTRDWANKSHDYILKKPLFIGIPLLKSIGKLYNLFCNNKKGGMLSNIVSLIPYSNGNKVFCDSNTFEILGERSPYWKKYLANLLEYAYYKGFLNHNGRTVFEQVMYRMKSKKNPVTFHNISPKGIEKIEGQHLFEDINKTVSSMIAIGVKKGMNVAIVGNASTRYLSVDIALGLIGAVSVPLYYTTPVEEISNYLKCSESSLIFVGSENILKKIDLLDRDIQVVAMCDIQVVEMRDIQVAEMCDIQVETATDRKILSWEAFLDTGNCSYKIESKVSYSDVATIRFTSGSTGQPKGVVFDNYNLKWMAESIASLLSWDIRNSDTRYLSFLPMSHVVEGILATYGSFYNLCKLDIYYLCDFSLLGEMLPKIKPTFFFSVPRFYEKIWEKFSQSNAANFYLNLSEGYFKKLLKPMLKFVLLKKSGLNKCRQLVVGSAPVSNELLQSFRNLDIEVHNAYGLTEAPLITMNRLGDNLIGTVGTALPQTQVKIAQDGEIMVSGPQVTKGYYNDQAKGYYSDGFFKTGDFGELTLDGKLMIVGRKKDLIITSYGKNIQPSKIECLLMGIKNVVNSMLVGDNLPYCTAIVWVNSNSIPENFSEHFSESIKKINISLSSPEMIRKWAVVGSELTIAAGELTPNLKLRRGVIIKNYNELVLSLYNDTDMPSYVLYSGSLQKTKQGDRYLV